MVIAHTEPLRADPAQAKAELAEVFARQRQDFLRAGSPSLETRRHLLSQLAAAIHASREAVVAAASADFGHRSRHETLFGEIATLLGAIRHTQRHLRRWMKPRRVAVPIELLTARARIIPQPRGVIGIITPWNYPFQLAVMPLVAALAAGNRAMLKPSEHTPNTSALLARIVAEHFRPEWVHVVLGGPSVGEAFAGLAFDHLFYTGSGRVGHYVMRAAAENLTPVTLELGGKSPAIIGDDAALAPAAESIMFGKLFNAGQTCIAPDYVLVPERLVEEFIRHLIDATRRMYPKLAENADYTSIVNERHYRRLSSMVEEARNGGARIIEINPAGEALEPERRRLAPTLVLDAADESRLMQDEIFGPILPIKVYRDLETAIAHINTRPRPLSLYYFGRDPKARDLVLARTTSGNAAVNETLMQFAVDNLPFGGIGASGMGAYHGKAGFDTFSHNKAVFLQSRLNGVWLLRPPYRRAADAILGFLLRR